MSDIIVITRDQHITVDPASQVVSVVSMGRPGLTGPPGPAGPTGPTGPTGPGGATAAQGIVAEAIRTSSTSVVHGTALSIVTGLTITFTTVATRRYKISAFNRGGNAGALGVRQLSWIVEVVATVDTVRQLFGDFTNQVAGGFTWATSGFYLVPAGTSGSVTFKVMCNSSASTFESTGAINAPLYIIAEDIGD